MTALTGNLRVDASILGATNDTFAANLRPESFVDVRVQPAMAQITAISQQILVTDRVANGIGGL